MAIKLRKLVVQVDETRIEMGQTIDPATRRAVAMAVIDNPYAGRYETKLDALIEAGEELGALLGNKCVEALGIAPGDAQSYGKAAIVGEAGELEHAAAILHPKLGAPLRVAVEKGAALVPSARHRDRRAARPQRRRLRAQPFRRDRSARGGRAARARDRGGRRRNGLGPAAAAHWRPAGERDQGRRRFALS